MYRHKQKRSFRTSDEYCLDNVNLDLRPSFLIKKNQNSVIGDLDEYVTLLKGTAYIIADFSLFWSIREIVCN